MQSCSTRVLSARRCQRQTAWTLWGSSCRSVTPWSCLVSHLTRVWRSTGTSLEFYAVRSCNYHMYALRHIRPLLTLDTAKTITHTVVSSRLDYANVRYVCHQPQQAASGTEHNVRGVVSITAFCQSHGVTLHWLLSDQRTSRRRARRAQRHPALRIITDYMLTNLYLLSYSRFLSNLHPPPLMKPARVPVARVLY